MHRKKAGSGVEPDLAKRSRGDDHDESDAEQIYLRMLSRSYSKHHQHLGPKTRWYLVRSPDPTGW